jgi:hypothetical protein
MLSREQERRRALERLPPPRLATPGYETLGFWLLQAHASPGTAIEYNKAIGALWAACTSTRTLPSPKEFDRAPSVARQTLDTAYTQATDPLTRRELERAT